ncbi:MAG: spore maturation protein [Oscillospiraceae bacterium]|nr:spore maturation protein [Oscillospiraceae bacterium]
MAGLSDFVLPITLVGILGYGIFKGVDVFGEFLTGAKEGLTTVVNIVPAIIALMTCVGMFKASGALDGIVWLFSPVAAALQLPQEVVPLAILRPISGSGALVIYNDILATHGPDSFIGRVASVIEGSSETTFYTIAVYYGAVKVSKTRYTLSASLSADLVGFVMSAFMVRMIFGF